ncbi:hypothetical protein BPJM79_30262 [Bacillus pumilus]
MTSACWPFSLLFEGAKKIERYRDRTVLICKYAAGSSCSYSRKTIHAITRRHKPCVLSVFSRKKNVANVILIHGGGAHSLAGYEHIADTLQHDFHVNTFLIDLRGHGQSEGKKGDTPSVTDVWHDISQFVDTVKQQHKGAVYLCGHSSGAGLLLNYLSWPKKREVDGYFFIAPEFGYQSGTSSPNQIPFATVQVWKFVLSAMT